MIRQFGLPMFFITFTSTKRLWDPFIKILHTLDASKLNLPNKIENVQSVHIVELIWINPITCAIYYDHRTFCFHKLITKDHSFFRVFFNFFSLLNSKLWERTWPWLLWSAHKWRNWTVCKHVYFFVMYHFYQTHCKMYNNINTHIHLRK